MGDLLVTKIGGNIIDDEAKLSAFLKEFASLNCNKILVHGGGKLASGLAAQLGIPQQLVDGRRITSGETIKLVTMVYAGYINKNIVAQLQAQNCNAIGISGVDANILQAHKRKHATIDFGFVGDIDQVNTGLLCSLLEHKMTIVMAPITHNKEGLLLNTNADTVAQEIARALSGLFEVTLLYTFEKSGVLSNAADENSVIPQLNPDSYKMLKAKQAIFAGMLPKLDNAFAALNGGVKKVIIGKSEKLEELILGNSGTTISNT